MFHRGLVISLFAAIALLVPASSALAAPQLLMPNGPALNPFGNIHLGGSNTRTLTIESVGDPVEITSFSVYPDAPGSDDFAITGDTCVGVTLNIFDTCDVTLKFTPLSVGTLNTTVFVNTTNPAADNAFGVQGTGIDPGINVTPFNHNFGNVPIGDYGTAQTFTIENDGDSPLETTSTLAGADSEEFFFVTQPGCANIEPDETCDVTVNLRPLENPGPRSASLVISNNTSEENPQTILLTATAVQGHLATDPAAIAFGNVDPYTAPAPNRTLTLSNDGNSNLKINDIDMHVGQANSYILDVAQCTDDLVLAPGDDCELNVTFKADNVLAGANNSAVSIYTSVGNSEIPVTATLIEGDIEFSTENVDVGDVEIGQSGTAVLNIYSTGTAPLLIAPDSPTIQGSSAAMFDVDVPNSCTGLTNTGLFCQAVVTFTPTSIAGKSASARFEGNFGTVDIGLSGRGVEAYANLPLDEAFGQIKVGDTKTITMRVLSNGDAPLNLDAPAVEGSDATFFSAEFVGGSCTNKVRGEECNVQLTYKPTAVGSHQASLHLTGNIDQSVPLTGSARALTPARISLKLTGPGKVKRGKTLTLKVKLKNSGETTAKNVSIRTTLPKKLARAVKPIRLSAIAGGKSVTKTIKVKVKKSANKGAKLKVKVTASGTGFKTGKAGKLTTVR